MAAPDLDLFCADPSLAPGELVGGRYRVESLLGSGGMGRVVAARDEDGASVAVKLLVAPAWRSVLVERFFREARTISRIDSPHVVKILAVSAPNEATPFMVMERLDGRDYGKRLDREGRLSLEDVADCVVQACAALACSHALGVIHRDVKPSNLFDHRNPDGTRTVKVLDFGISKARASAGASGAEADCEWTLTTTRDTMLGSPPYMSPEHLRDARAVDHRTDIWSLGVVAYQLLAGRLPFEGKTVGALFCSVLERRITPLTTTRPGLPATVVAIIDRCLAAEPADRFANAAELARAFAPFASTRVAKLALSMTTKVAVPLASAPRANGSMLSNLAAGERIDGAPRTMTIVPALPAPEPSTPLQRASAADVTTLASPTPARAAIAAEPSPYDDDDSRAVTTVLARPTFDSLPPVVAITPLSRARMAARTTLARRRAGFAAAACTLLVALLVSPFAFSSAPSRIQPAVAAAAAAPHVTAPPTQPSAADDDVTFEVSSPNPVTPEADLGAGAARVQPERAERSRASKLAAAPHAAIATPRGPKRGAALLDRALGSRR
jgi:serine/threonine-protein kinase